MDPRIIECFDFDWRFHPGDIPGAEERAYPDSDWQQVDLPHDWSIEGPFLKTQPSGGAGGYAPCGIGWYRKTFTLPDQPQPGKVFLEFDGVYMNSTVWVNGVPVGRHSYGYTSFSLDVTDAVAHGSGANVVAVRVDNSAQPGSRWYSGSGIYRHTRLVCTDSLHFDYQGISATSVFPSGEDARLDVRAHIRNERAHRVTAALRIMLVDDRGSTVGSTLSPFDVPPRAEKQVALAIRVRDPNLWSLESPSLYRLVSEIVQEEQVADRSEISVGMRAICFDADRGFLLNSQRVKIRGVCLHHDAGCVGAAVPEEVWERRLTLLKEMGCNAVRASHNPPSPELLDMCDRMGILVMDEAFDEWRIGKEKEGDARFGYHCVFDAEAEGDLRAMVRRDRNHPSIVLWSIGNEIPEQDTPEGGALAGKLAAVVHEEDDARPVTSACDHIGAEPVATDPSFLEALDVVGYNYANRWRLRTETCYEEDRVRFPLRKIIGSENISVGGPRGDIDAPLSFPPDAIGAPFHGHMVLAEQLLKITETRDYVAGDFMWTGVDYLGESRWPLRVAASGVVDTCGFVKDGYFLYQSVWTRKPVLHLFPHWNHSQAGKIIQVFCFTNCDEVELFLNARSFGKKHLQFPRQGMSERWAHYDRPYVHPTTADLHLTWDVPFEPGVLSAAGRRNGEPCCRAELRTTGDPASVLLEPDKVILRANRRDVAHVIVRIADAAGYTVPLAGNRVHLEVEGEARLIGFDNGKPDDHTDYRSKERAAFNGLCLAIVRATGAPGPVRITASSPGLSSGQCKIHSKAS
ncbi:MAG: glycoside hydrolase family 2 TIM barrel-domain containing protein [Spirochaetia bacterium]|jgi:beta-galactosidase